LLCGTRVIVDPPPRATPPPPLAPPLGAARAAASSHRRRKTARAETGPTGASPAGASATCRTPPSGAGGAAMATEPEGSRPGLPPHLEGHRYVAHVAGPPTRPEGEKFTYQRCIRCDGALQIVDGGRNNAEPVEPGTLWTYILGPKYRGYCATTPEVLAHTRLCEPQDPLSGD